MCIKGVCHTTKKKISTIISSKKRHHRQLTKNEVRFFFFFWYGDKYFKAIDSGRLEAKKSRWRPSKRTILNKFPLLIRLANENSSHIHDYLSIFFLFFFIFITILAHELSVSVRLIKIKPCKGRLVPTDSVEISKQVMKCKYKWKRRFFREKKKKKWKLE